MSPKNTHPTEINKYTIQGDISGIQEYIFGVASKGAAKSLKSRSYYIQLVSEACVEFILRKAKGAKKIYDGGGTFRISVPNSFTEIDFSQIKETFDKEFEKDDISVSLTKLSLKKNDNIWDILPKKSAQDKFNLLRDAGYELLFNNADEQGVSKLQDGNERKKSLNAVRGRYAKNIFNGLPNAEDITQTSNLSKEMREHPFRNSGELIATFFTDSTQLVELRKTKDDFETTVLNKLPLWSEELLKEKETLVASVIKEIEEKNKLNLGNAKSSFQDEYIKPELNNIIDFNFLSAFAKERTGTGKLGVLKMDVDDLGLLFKNVDKIKHGAKKGRVDELSEKFHSFFNEGLYDIQSAKTFEYYTKIEDAYLKEKNSFKHNIYPVFAGGDDSFLIGGWDAILEFTLEVNEAYQEFGEELLKDGLVYQESSQENLQAPTLSAGLIIVDEHYPVVRLAEEVEEALEASKRRQDKTGKRLKNAISIFGEVFTWDEFKKIRRLAFYLSDLILKEGESKALLGKIKRVDIGLTSLYSKATQGKVHPASAWRLKYFIARTVKKENLKSIEKEIVNDFYKGIIHKFAGQDELATNPAIYPAAARWAELLIRFVK
jgi:CRISPR-associated protein Csm1